MRYLVAVAAAVFAVVVTAGPVAAASNPDPPNKTGCCFSFDDSPVTLVFCMTENACEFGGPR